MRETEFNKAQVAKYLLWTFVLAYIIQVGAAWVAGSGDAVHARMIMAAMMLVPALGVLLVGGKLKDMGWKLKFRENIKPLLLAWFAPLLLTALGTALYFLVFPGQLDLSGQALVENGGAEALEQLEAQGVSYPMYMLINAIGCVTYAPLINMVFALGEEIGWRGFLYPQLKAKLGQEKGWLLGGVIWGVWHWPLIVLIGYEYGFGYVGFPFTGMLLFCVITAAWGILHDVLYEKSGSIWVPAIFHGALNAAATLPLAVWRPVSGSVRLLGPAPNGLLAGLPFLLAAGVLLWRASRGSGEQA